MFHGKVVSSLVFFTFQPVTAKLALPIDILLKKAWWQPQLKLIQYVLGMPNLSLKLSSGGFQFSLMLE